ncbi:Hypothetical predicted protein [Octopus vulgaris]|uniref:Uncharacterized protein n=1 Tax=Octopus vulgaris TaxID=6645 RepID=A0AA36BN44_OCTVU|nr:Hypothetical predicted protein [Octopus vulgaris]
MMDLNEESNKALLLNAKQYSLTSSLIDPQMIKYEYQDLSGKGSNQNDNLIYEDTFVGSYDKMLSCSLESQVLNQNGIVDSISNELFYPKDSHMSPEDVALSNKMLVSSPSMMVSSPSTENMMARQGHNVGLGDADGSKLTVYPKENLGRMDTAIKIRHHYEFLKICKPYLSLENIQRNICEI